MGCERTTPLLCSKEQANLGIVCRQQKRPPHELYRGARERTANLGVVALFTDTHHQPWPTKYFCLFLLLPLYGGMNKVSGAAGMQAKLNEIVMNINIAKVFLSNSVAGSTSGVLWYCWRYVYGRGSRSRQYYGREISNGLAVGRDGGTYGHSEWRCWCWWWWSSTSLNSAWGLKNVKQRVFSFCGHSSSATT